MMGKADVPIGFVWVENDSLKVEPGSEKWGRAEGDSGLGRVREGSSELSEWWSGSERALILGCTRY